jgi:hypothetical protein
VHVAINKIHPETFRIHSPAWDHQRLFAAGRALEAELELTPLRSMAREREKLSQRAADCEAHQGIDSFARWTRKTLAPALRATPLQSWDEVHNVCGRFGVVLRLHGNGLVFEDARHLCTSWKPAIGRLTGIRPSRPRWRRACGMTTRSYSTKPVCNASTPGAATETPPPTSVDDSRRSTDTSEAYLPPCPSRVATEGDFHNSESRALKRKLANQRQAIQKCPHPGSWRHFVASRAASRDARAIRLLQRQEQERSPWDLERGS